MTVGRFAARPLVFWNPDGAWLGTLDESMHLLQVWNIAAEGAPGAEALRLEGMQSAVWSPDGSRLAAMTDDPSVQIWDIAANTQILALDGVQFIGWSPDGSMLVGRDDRYQRIWDATSGEILATLNEHGGQVMWSPSGERFAEFFQGIMVLWER